MLSGCILLYLALSQRSRPFAFHFPFRNEIADFFFFLIQSVCRNVIVNVIVLATKSKSRWDSESEMERETPTTMSIYIWCIEFSVFKSLTRSFKTNESSDATKSALSFDANLFFKRRWTKENSLGANNDPILLCIDFDFKFDGMNIYRFNEQYMYPTPVRASNSSQRTIGSKIIDLTRGKAK